LEKYKITENGYHPFLISEGWQVAQLNYMDEQHIDNIYRMEVHHKTDEVFVLLKGKAVLILAEFEDNDAVFEVELMKPRTTYNIPKNKWHNIAMEEGSEVLIVEKSNTHLKDFSFKNLSINNLKALKEIVEEVLNKKQV
jgi:mannose-6-phosphate isomerase-like protein (cupin superfamily)